MYPAVRGTGWSWTTGEGARVCGRATMPATRSWP